MSRIELYRMLHTHMNRTILPQAGYCTHEYRTIASPADAGTQATQLVRLPVIGHSEQ